MTCAMQVMTWGSPYPANRAYCREFDAAIPDCWCAGRTGFSCGPAAALYGLSMGAAARHCVHDGDPVPRTAKFGLYKVRGVTQGLCSSCWQSLEHEQVLNSCNIAPARIYY